MEGVPIIVVEYLISDRSYDIKVYEEDCETDVDETVFDMTYNDTEADEQGFLDVEARLMVNQEEIENSNIWDPESLMFSFCMTTSLFTYDNIIAVRRLREIFHVTVNNMADFNSFNILLVEEDIDETDLVVDYQGEVTSYQCDPITLKEIEDPPALGPSDILNICIEEVSDKAVTVNSVYSLVLTQAGGTGMSYLAIQDGSAVNLQLTTVQDSDGVALVRIQLIDVFFIETTDITVSGSVSLEGGDVGRNDGEPFTMNVQLNEPCEGNLLQRMIGRLIERFN